MSEMGKKTTPYRVYDPESFTVMGMAFDGLHRTKARSGREYAGNVMPRPSYESAW